jgi:tetratricopeptide (TPR) repeat protein
MSTATPRLLRLLGQGGMGAVYEAEVPGDPRRFALKVVSALSAESRVRFQREGELAARVRHRNVVQVHGRGRLPDGRDYLLFELVNGTPLDEVLAQRGRITKAEALRIGAQLADALAAGHAAGIVHRDIKPANVLLDAAGDVRLADFGIALALDQERLTHTGQWPGTLGYMAPEQLGTGEPIGPHTDVRAVGALLFQALTGRLPFLESGPQLVARVVLDDPPSLGTATDDADHDLTAIVDRCLSRDSSQRYEDGAALAADLRAAAEGRPIRARLRRGKSPRWLLMLVPLAVVAGLVGVGLVYEPSEPAQPIAETPERSGPAPTRQAEDEPPAEEVPEWVTRALEDAYAAAAEGKLERALEQFEVSRRVLPEAEASRIYREQAAASVERGRALEDGPNPELAMPHWELAVALDPSAVTYQGRGELCVILDQGREAVEDFTRALELQRSVEVFCLRAKQYRLLGEPELALEDYHEALAIDPSSARARGDVHELFNDFETNPDHARSETLWRRLAGSCLARDNRSGALRAYEHVLELNPDAEDAVELRESIARLRAELGRE